MKKDRIINIIDNMSGIILGIGLTEDKYLDEINNNDNILTCHLMNLNSVKEGIAKQIFKTKTINIKQIKKKFKKKRIDYIICKIDDIKDYLRTFIKDSIYIGKKEIYYYGDIKKETYDAIIRKYKRYNVNIEEISDKIIKIDIRNAKNNKFKELIYSIIDFNEYLVELIVNILIG